MIIGVDELLSMPAFAGADAAELQRKLNGIESLIRTYTNNNFQVRSKRLEAPSAGGKICGTLGALIREGDTVQITESVNDGLYVVIEIADGCMTLDVPIMDAANNRVTKIEYPAAVVSGVVDLLRWEIANRKKVGIKTETLSRHSVTYFDQDANNQLLGYPPSLLGFLSPFVKARF